jgi:hypothetical protein
VIDAEVRGNAARWINHMRSQGSYEDDEGRVYIEARRTIRAAKSMRPISTCP